MSETKISWTDSMTQKMTSFFEKEHIQLAIRNKVLDPVMNHILKRIYPYIVLICVMFCLLLVSVLLNGGGGVAVAVTATVGRREVLLLRGMVFVETFLKFLRVRKGGKILTFQRGEDVLLNTKTKMLWIIRVRGTDSLEAEASCSVPVPVCGERKIEV